MQFKRKIVILLPFWNRLAELILNHSGKGNIMFFEAKLSWNKTPNSDHAWQRCFLINKYDSVLELKHLGHSPNWASNLINQLVQMKFVLAQT